MSGLSKLGATLIVVFILCFLVLIADLVYVIWRRRRFQRRTFSPGESVATTGDDSTYALSSKELLYFFCWNNNRARIEPNITNNRPDPNNNTTTQTALEVDELLRLQELYRQTRLLFTIKEEDFEAGKTDQESKEQSSISITSSADRDDDDDDQGFVRSTLTDDGDSVMSMKVDEATPFSTPCASPLYFTPSPSPSREELKQFYSNENIGRVEEEAGTFHCSLDMIGV
ncbi:uncharacterized protein LOC115698769 [Cannabis sativa]|uniref:uncharacterized protein LOC115698769 n=1 Tax=Cannabis sativa TaxID=3483 RepID=UPI0029CA2C8B|nr:uncharacterized protein LOC115698769 [Cannabis sativa]